MFADSSRLLNGLLNLLLQSVPFPWKSELKSFANPYIINVFQVFQEPDQLKWYPKWVSKFFWARFQRNRISSNPFIAKLIVQCDQQVETPPLWNSERPLFSRSLWVFALDLFVEKKMAKQFFFFLKKSFLLTTMLYWWKVSFGWNFSDTLYLSVLRTSHVKKLLVCTEICVTGRTRSEWKKLSLKCTDVGVLLGSRLILGATMLLQAPWSKMWKRK